MFLLFLLQIAVINCTLGSESVYRYNASNIISDPCRKNYYTKRNVDFFMNRRDFGYILARQLGKSGNFGKKSPGQFDKTSNYGKNTPSQFGISGNFGKNSPGQFDKISNYGKNTPSLFGISGNFGKIPFSELTNSVNVNLFKNCSNGECVSFGNSTAGQILSGLLIHHDLPHSHWLEYKSVYNKLYRSQRQELAALSRWRDNLRRVAEHNRMFLAGKLSYSLHLNQFGDWDRKDYLKNILKFFDTRPLFDPAEDVHRTSYHLKATRKVPAKVDWRAKGFKPKLEEQWKCGACYAFAVTHALQAQLFKKHGDWKELSPQQIVDCSAPDGNMGCDGGSLRAAMRYAARKGLISEEHYPYTGKKGRCKEGTTFAHTQARRWALLPRDDEGAIETALATIGPLAVAVNAAPFTFQLYRSGIYDDPFCVSWQLNHAMLLVGYTPQYWILLNWWGKNWGEDGYIRIRRGRHRCGVTKMAAYVEL